MTCDEVEEATGLTHQTCSARVNELASIGYIDWTRKRKTRSGRNARVYCWIHRPECDLDEDCSCA